MRVGIIGAGAIGTWLAAKLADQGHDVSMLARGKTLENLRANGARLRAQGHEISASVTASDIASNLGLQDLLIYAVKAQSLPAAALAGQSMIDAQTTIMSAMNGVPWWFLNYQNSSLKHCNLASVDPDQISRSTLPIEQTLGCVIHASTYNIAPGYVQHVMGDDLIIGPAHPEASQNVDKVVSAMHHAGFNAKSSKEIRQEIWYKLWGNMTMNPISAITGATCDIILDDPGTRALATAVMNEAIEIGDKIGCPITDSPESRHAKTRKLGPFKTSMLQDAEAGKPLEINALLAAPQEIARLLGLKTPALDHLLGLVRVYENARQRTTS